MRRMLFVSLLLAAGLAHAQDYPAKPIRMIVPYPPGGGTDVVARIVNEKLSLELGQSIVIDNKGGAGGSVGTEIASKAAPDGYTILLTLSSHTINPKLFPKLGYDVERDFIPISLAASIPQILVANPSVPASNMQELLAWMKANPGKGTFVDQNAAARVTGILMQQSTGTKIEFIPYRGAGPAMQAMLGGQVDLMVVQAAVTLPQARAGAVKILANLSPARSRVIPDIPTSEESGIPGLYASGWFGLFAPRATPKEIVAKLNGAMMHALADAKVQARFADLGLDVAPRGQQTSEGLAAFHKGEIEKWWPIIKAAGIKVE